MIRFGTVLMASALVASCTWMTSGPRLTTTPSPVSMPNAVGTNSHIGSGDASPDGNAQIAWNSRTDEFIYVWSTHSGMICQESFVANEGSAIRAKIVQASIVGVSSPVPGYLTVAGNADGTGAAQCPQVAYDRTRNRYLVVWHEASDDAWHFIKARDVSANGTLGSIQTVAAASRFPHLAFNGGTGEFLLSYSVELRAAPEPRLEFKRFFPRVCRSGSGAAGPWTCGFTGSEMWNGRCDGHCNSWAVVSVQEGPAPNARYLVVWPARNENANSPMARGVLLDADLQPVPGPDRVADEFTISAVVNSNPSAGSASKGTVRQFLVVHGDSSQGGPQRIWGRILTDDPTICGAGWCFRATTSSISDPIGQSDSQPGVVSRIAGCPGERADGCFLVAWTRNPMNPIAYGARHLYGRIVGFDGALGPEGRPKHDTDAVVHTSAGSSPPMASRFGGTSTVFAWSDTRGSSDPTFRQNREIYSDWWHTDSSTTWQFVRMLSNEPSAGSSSGGDRAGGVSSIPGGASQECRLCPAPLRSRAPRLIANR